MFNWELIAPGDELGDRLLSSIKYEYLPETMLDVLYPDMITYDGVCSKAKP